MTQNDSLILVGGGGHCKSCIDVIEQEGKHKIGGIIDLPHKIGEKILGYEVIGSDLDLPLIAKTHTKFLITIGHLGNPTLRNNILRVLVNLKVEMPVIASPSAYISKHSKIDFGSIIMHHALINAGVSVGNNCIINTKAIIEHDSQIGNNTHISTGAIINGDCSIEENCFIGSGVVVSHSIKINKNTIIGSGSSVIKNIIESGTYVGVPAKKIK